MLLWVAASFILTPPSLFNLLTHSKSYVEPPRNFGNTHHLIGNYF